MTIRYDEMASEHSEIKRNMFVVIDGKLLGFSTLEKYITGLLSVTMISVLAWYTHYKLYFYRIFPPLENIPPLGLGVFLLKIDKNHVF